MELNSSAAPPAGIKQLTVFLSRRKHWHTGNTGKS
jgi:hypothetical protein